MVVIRRDTGLAAVAAAGPSGVSIGMLWLGIAALVIASGLCAAFYIQLRKTRAFRAEMVQQEKRAKIGKPVLQRAPSDVVEASLDLSQMTLEMRQHAAQRHLQPVRPPLPAHKSSTITWSLPQGSSGSSGTSTSGPIPTSSSESTNASSGAKSSERTTSNYHSAPASQAHHNIVPQRPQRSATQSTSPPSFMREKRVTRVAVPSALLRGLGDLPQLSASGSEASPNTPVNLQKNATPNYTLDLEKNAVKPSALNAGLEEYSWLNRDLTNLARENSSKKKMCDLEAQLHLSTPTDRKITAGPSPITVDYFSLTSRRNMTPTRLESTTKKPKMNTGKHSASSSQSSSSPYKRPSMELPPLPKVTKKQSNNTSSVSVDSIFRPLSLGLFLKSSSKSSSLNAATMFGNLSDSLWSDASEKPVLRSSTPKKEVQEQSVSTSISKDSTVHTALLSESRRGSETSDTATSVNDAYDGASFNKEGEEVQVQESQMKEEKKDINKNSEVQVVQAAREEPRDAIPASVFRDGTSFAPFMTPHHRAVFPDQINEEDDKTSSGAMTPDLSQIHSAPLPPATFPVHSLAPSKGGFASSFRARAKMTLSRAKTISTPSHQPPSLARQAVDVAMKSLDVIRPRADSLAVLSRSPAESVNSYATVNEGWKFSTEEVAPARGLGLGLTDENGKAMDHNISLVQDSRPLLHSPAFEKHIGNRASSKISQYSDAEFSPTTRHTFQSPMHEDHLGSPPVQQLESAQYGVLSTLSPKYGQTPTMVGNDWVLNRQQSNHAHKPSYASSACDTISSCMTGESMSMYDGAKAQDQRAKLLQTIQQGKKASFDQDKTDENAFLSHSVNAPPSTPSNVGDATMRQKKTITSPCSSKNPANLTVEIKRGAVLESNAPHTAPLTPPLTPSEQSYLLAKAAPLQEKQPSREEQTAARMAKLRPLSLAVQQQNSTPRPTSSWHRPQYSTASTITAPSTSSSNSSLYTSPNRISSTLTSVTSPSRANFYKSSGVPLGVLPTLTADASPSFLTSTPRISAATASPRSPNQSVTWADLATPSPRFSRASININTMPYHSPLSIHAFTSPLRLQK